jgi:hypothetical protein
MGDRVGHGPRAGTNEVGHSSYGTTRITGCEDSRQQPAQSTDSSVSRHVSERNERLVVFCSDVESIGVAIHPQHAHGFHIADFPHVQCAAIAASRVTS